jgi:6-phospho-3-hexuloisomerase
MRSYHEWTTTIVGEINGALQAVDAERVGALGQEILKAKRVFAAGKGRSGLFMRAFAMRLMHLGLTVHVVDDVTTPNLAAGDVLVLASGSGRTPSVVQYATKAKTLGARVGLITAFPDSPAAQQADVIVTIAAPSDKAVGVSTVTSAQPMANLFEQALGLLLDIITLQLMAERGLTGEQMFARHANLE